MTRQTVMIAALLLAGAGCKGKSDKKEEPKGSNQGSSAQQGSSTTPKPSGSGSSTGSNAMSGSGSGAGSGSAAAPAVPLTGEALAKHYTDCISWINAGKLDDYKDKCIDKDIADHEVDVAEHRGADGVIAYLKEQRAAMPDFKIEPQIVMVSGRAIAAVLFLSAKHTGPLKGPGGAEIKPSDRKIGLLAYHHLRTNEDNKVVEQWEFLDHQTLQAQLGIAPKEQAPTRAALDKAPLANALVLVAKDDAAEKASIDLVNKQTELFNAHKAAESAAMWTDDVLEADQASEKDTKGKKEVEAGLKFFFGAFPDVKLTTTFVAASGEYVIQEGRITGTNKGAMGPMKATNKAVDVHLAEVYKVKDGKIAEMWRFRDEHAMEAQLMGKEPPKDAGAGSGAGSAGSAGSGSAAPAAGSGSAAGSAAKKP